MPSPTARTLNRLRREGWLAAVVETFIPRVNRKRDLWGIGDVLAVHARDRRTMIVQCTSAAHVADRLKRVRARPETAHLLRAGVSVEIWGWLGGRLKRVALTGEDLHVVTLEAPRPRRGRKGERQRDLFPDAPGSPPGPPGAPGRPAGRLATTDAAGATPGGPAAP